MLQNLNVESTSECVPMGKVWKHGNGRINARWWVWADLSCPAVSQSCRVTLVEPTVKVFIWKSIPDGLVALVEGLGHGAGLTEKLTHSGANPPLQLPRAEAMNEGGLTHPGASQENHFEDLLRTCTRLLQFRRKHQKCHSDICHPGVEYTPHRSFRLVRFVTPDTIRGMGSLGLLQLTRWVQPSSEQKKKRTDTNEPLLRTNGMASLQRETPTLAVACPVTCSYLWLSPASAKSLWESKNVHVESEAE